MLGFWQGILQHLGSGGRTVLHRFYHEPVHNFNRQIYRSKILLKIPHNHDRKESRGNPDSGLGVLDGDFNWTTVRMEGTAAFGRKHLQHNRRTRLCPLLFPVLVLPPAHGHLSDVFQGLCRSQTDY